MDISELTIGQARELAAMLGGVMPPPAGADLLTRYLGQAIVVRTVTYHYLGKLEHVTATGLLLSDASWLADSGRWHLALAEGLISEVEPYPGECVIERGAVVDVSPWPHELPRSAK